VRIYLLYDERAIGGNPDDAVCFEVCDSRGEAWKAAPSYGGCVCISYARAEPLSDPRQEFIFRGGAFEEDFI
jgi:hypothetical protein